MAKKKTKSKIKAKKRKQQKHPLKRKSAVRRKAEPGFSPKPVTLVTTTEFSAGKDSETPSPSP